MELKKYKNKSEEYMYYLKGGKEVKHGSHKYWYDNGQINYEENYKDGKRHGLYKRWYENGQVMYEYNYKDGKHHGLYKRWYDNGQINYE